MGLESVKSASMSNYAAQGSSAAKINTASSVQGASSSAAENGEDTRSNSTIEVMEADRSSKDKKNGGQASQEAIKKAVDEINKHANGSEAIFGIHETTNRVTIKIVDKKTKEVIKEFPAEETLDMIAKVWEMAGIMVDEKR